jgi:hypothetical protein
MYSTNTLAYFSDFMVLNVLLNIIFLRIHAVNITVSDLKVIFAVIDKRSSLFFYLITLISCKKYITNVKSLITHDCESSMASY